MPFPHDFVKTNFHEVVDYRHQMQFIHPAGNLFPSSGQQTPDKAEPVEKSLGLLLIPRLKISVNLIELNRPAHLLENLYEPVEHPGAQMSALLRREDVSNKNRDAVALVVAPKFAVQIRRIS